MGKRIMPFRLTNREFHSRSPYIFLITLAGTIVATGFLLTRSLPPMRSHDRVQETPPVIIQLQNIPETRQVVRTPAPPKPFIPDALPIASDDLMPDTITIKDTKLDLAEAPSAPPAILVPNTAGNSIPSASAEEEEIFEYFNVEEPPKRTTAVQPEYPEMAKRAGIEGTVMLKVLVNTKGDVDSVEVQSGPSIFHKPAETAARKTRFQPARQNDRAVPCWVIMPFRFVMQNGR